MKRTHHERLVDEGLAEATAMREARQAEKRRQALKLRAEGLSVNFICKRLKLSSKTLAMWTEAK